MCEGAWLSGLGLVLMNIRLLFLFLNRAVHYVPEQKDSFWFAPVHPFSCPSSPPTRSIMGIESFSMSSIGSYLEHGFLTMTNLVYGYYYPTILLLVYPLVSSSAGSIHPAILSCNSFSPHICKKVTTIAVKFLCNGLWSHPGVSVIIFITYT